MIESPHMSSGYRFRAHRLVPDGAAAMAWDPLRDAIVELSDGGGMQPARHLPEHSRRWSIAGGLLWHADEEQVEVRALDGALCERWVLPTPPFPTTSPWCFGPHALVLGCDETLWTLRLGEHPCQ
jgi:hypothetical protein